MKILKLDIHFVKNINLILNREVLLMPIENREDFIKSLPIVEDIKITPDLRVVDLLESMGKMGGFVAKKLYTAAQILLSMLKEKDSINFLSFPACIIATGLRGVITEFIKRGYFDIIITTCGTLDHDIARCWRDYLHGWFEADDRELSELQIHRLGNIFIPYENYGEIIEEVMQHFLKEYYSGKSKSIPTYQLIADLGEYIDKHCPKKEESLIWWAWKNNVKIIVPGITDGAVGYQIWMFYQENKRFSVNVLEDEQYLAEIVFDAKKSGALVIGGGISKHHVIWWNQFKEGLDNVVYITTAVEWDGSLSGARTREAISWGKVRKNASHITVEGDATVLLPILAAYLINNYPNRKKE